MAGSPSETREAGGPPPSRTLVDVFISHGSDDVELARSIRGHLETGGFRCWMAPDDVTGPESWAEQIVQAIQGCRVMLVLISDRANRSPHVSKEVDLAMSAGKPLLPVRVEDVLPKGALQYLLALAQWVDAFPGSVDEHVAAVKSRIVAILGDEVNRAGSPRAAPAEAVSAGPTSPQPAPAEVTPSRVSRLPAWAPWAGGALVVVLIVTAVALATRGGGDETTTTATTAAAITDVPFSYGDDAVLDGLWDGCAGGALQACETLAFEAPFGSEYRDYGETCGFRSDGCSGLSRSTGAPVEEREVFRVRCEQGDPGACLQLYESAVPGSDDEVLAITCGYGAGTCAAEFGEPFTYGDDPYLDELWDGCAAGQAAVCRELFDVSPINSIYEHYGYICGRLDTGCDGLSSIGLSDAVLDQLYDECGAGALAACGELALKAPEGSFYEDHGLTCAYIDGGCTTLIGEAAMVGDHDYLDDLWFQCVGGSARHCNVLWWWSPAGSDYEWFAEVCTEPAASGLPCDAAIP